MVINIVKYSKSTILNLIQNVHYFLHILLMLMKITLYVNFSKIIQIVKIIGIIIS